MENKERGTLSQGATKTPTSGVTEIENEVSEIENEVTKEYTDISSKTATNKINQMRLKFIKFSEFERGVFLCVTILITYSIIMSVIYQKYHVGIVNSVHLVHIHETPSARIKFKSLGPPIPFIASIIERVFYDDSSEYKFKCTAVLLENNTVLTSSTCISSTKYNQTQKVRILSSLWSETGLLFDILDYKNIKKWFVAIKLDNPVHNPDPKNNAQLLTPEEFENINKITDNVTSYCWDHSYFVPHNLRRRKKYNMLSKKEFKVAGNNKCTNYPKNFDGICVIEYINRDDYFNELLDGKDSIFLKDSNKLIGIEIKRELWNNTIEHYYQFVRNINF